MFPTESKCHRDYELTRILIRLPAITQFSNPQMCMEMLTNYYIRLNKVKKKKKLSSVPTPEVMVMPHSEMS